MGNRASPYTFGAMADLCRCLECQELAQLDTAGLCAACESLPSVQLPLPFPRLAASGEFLGTFRDGQYVGEGLP